MKGELEETMLLNFCAGAKVKAILQHPEAAAIVQRASTILQKCRDTQGDTSFDVDMRLLHEISVKNDRSNMDTHDATEEIPILAHMVDMLMATGINCQEGKIAAYRHCRLSGIQFATHQAPRRDCYVFFKDGELLHPGRIDLIFGVMSADRREEHFAAVRRNLPIPEGMEDPFWSYTDFGAGLWKEDYAEDLCIVPLVQVEICHAISMPWVDGILVIKPLNRVSNHTIASHSGLTHGLGRLSERGVLQ